MWRRLFGPWVAYPRVQLFFEKIKIRKLFEDTLETKKYGSLPDGMVRGASFAIYPYYIYFDVYEDSSGKGHVFITEVSSRAEKIIAEWYQQHHNCKYKGHMWCRYGIKNEYEHPRLMCRRNNCPLMKNNKKRGKK